MLVSMVVAAFPRFAALVPGRVLAVAALAAIATHSADLRAAPDCLTSSGKTACGYHCKASEGQSRCAQSPEGVCTIGSGMVICWDPPPLLRKIVEDVPAPTCVTSGGQTACGYGCISNYDRVQCAQTPFGACLANEGKLVCWDPPATVLLARKDKTPSASCIANYGDVACGYHCIANNGQVRCVDTPQGICRSERDSLLCWDPPLETAAAAFNPGSELACIDAPAGRACGFRCLVTRKRSACGTGRDDTCRVEGEEIVCKSR